jgi:hypothetical protein
MYKPGGPKLVLDRRASTPRTPSCPAVSQTTPEGTPVRLPPSQSEQGVTPPSRTTPGPPLFLKGGPAPSIRIYVDHSSVGKRTELSFPRSGGH